ARGPARGAGVAPAPLPHRRPLPRRAAPAERARAAVARSLRPPGIEDIRLVGAWARPAVSALRRSHECPARSAALAQPLFGRWSRGSPFRRGAFRIAIGDPAAGIS